MTNTASLESPGHASRAIPAIFWGGFVVGVLDLTYAIVVYSPHHPIRIPQTIASGVLGVKSYQEGAASTVLGVFLHFVIAWSAATLYFIASRELPFMIGRAIPAGMIFGALVYGFMHLVVLPLSAAPKSHIPLPYAACEFVEHWFFVGLPIALSVRKFTK